MCYASTVLENMERYMFPCRLRSHPNVTLGSDFSKPGEYDGWATLIGSVDLAAKKTTELLDLFGMD
jgi:hypothetical protein